MHSVPDGATVVGIPGRVVRARGEALGQLEHGRVAECGEAEAADNEPNIARAAKILRGQT